MKNPKVSVITPTYNLAKYIGETIDSVLCQTFRDFEIIVVDDGSTDNTREVLSKYNGKIRYFYKENGGQWSAANKAIKLSKGKYIAFLDADDIWLPDKLRLQVNFLEQNPDYGAVYCDTYLFDNKGTHSKTILQTYRGYSGYILDKLCLQNHIAELTMVVKKECLERNGLYDPTISLVPDYDMWLRISKEYKIGLINAPLAKYRFRRKGCISSNSIGMYQGFIQCVDRAISRSPHLKKTLGLKLRKRFSDLYFKLGCAFFKKKEFEKAKEALLKSIVYWPLSNLKKFYLIFCAYLPEVAIEKMRLLKTRIKLHANRLKWVN